MEIGETDKPLRILECTFNGTECDMVNDIKPVWDPVFGLCYTYDVNIQQKYTGPSHGTYIN